MNSSARNRRSKSRDRPAEGTGISEFFTPMAPKNSRNGIETERPRYAFSRERIITSQLSSNSADTTTSKSSKIPATQSSILPKQPGKGSSMSSKQPTGILRRVPANVSRLDLGKSVPIDTVHIDIAEQTLLARKINKHWKGMNQRLLAVKKMQAHLNGLMGDVQIVIDV